MTNIPTTDVPKFHPLDSEDGRSPYAALDAYRERCPVAHVSRPGEDPVALVTRYDDVCKVYRSTSVGSIPQFGNASRHAVYGDPDDLPVLSLSGAAHARARRVVMRAVTPKAVTEAMPYIEKTSRTVVQGMPSDGRMELKEIWASRIPSRVISHMLGVPEDDDAQFYEWTQLKIKAFYLQSQGITGWEEEFDRAELAFSAYMREQVDRHRQPGAPEDALSRMLEAEDEEGHLSDGLIIANVIFLLNAGNQTTQNLLCNTVMYLAGQSGAYERVRSDRSLVDAALEESLRMSPPIMYASRTMEHDLDLDSASLPAGEPVIISNYAANRDPRVWGQHADEYDLDRKHPQKHLAFAVGPHACFGSALARVVARVSLNHLLDRYASITLAPDFVWERSDFWTSNGAKHLEVYAVAASGRG